MRIGSSMAALTSSRLFGAICILIVLTTADGESTFSRPSKVPQAKIGIDNDNHMFVDEYGRVRIFHGINCVRKYFPWYPEYLFNDTRLDDIEKAGVNVVRLGTMWTGVEPVEGVYNDTYIDTLRDIIVRLKERGIFTVLDMHQDVMAEKYGTYDGMPRWLVDSFPEPTNPFPSPFDSITAWAQGYLTQACSESFQCLYNNTNGALEKWGQFWAVVAQRLGRDEPAVLGYEWINEPWAGDYFQQPSLITPGEAGRQNLLPTYDYLNSIVRQYDTQTIQFYEPTTYGVVFDNGYDYLGSGFDRVPGGWYYEPLSVYAYHTYCWYLESLGSGGTDEERLEAAAKCTNDLLPRIFDVQDQDVKKVGGASMLTEFGLCKTESETGIGLNCSVYMDLADDWLQSWIDWDYSDNMWYRDGVLKTGRQKEYSRPYARATAGLPTKMKFDATTRHFDFTYKPNRSIPTDVAPTEIFISASLQYTSGFSVETSPPEVTWEVDGDLLYVRHAGFDDSNFPAEISIHVTPLSS